MVDNLKRFHTSKSVRNSCIENVLLNSSIAYLAFFLVLPISIVFEMSEEVDSGVIVTGRAGTARGRWHITHNKNNSTFTGFPPFSSSLKNQLRGTRMRMYKGTYFVNHYELAQAHCRLGKMYTQVYVTTVAHHSLVIFQN